MQGTVLAAPARDRAGMIGGNDGQRYRFVAAALQNGDAYEGQSVDFQAHGGEAHDIYVVRSAGPLGRVAGKRDWVSFYLSPKGRASRREYWLLGVLPVTLVSVALGWIPLVGWALTVAAFWALLALGIKRFHDRGYSGWWSVAGIIPGIAGSALLISWLVSSNPKDLEAASWAYVIAGIIFVLQMALVLLRRGQPGPNKYGPDPEAL